MIKLLRKIRQNLFFNNYITKYLLYAAGEIILVVLGILIALQINNWNEGRKLVKLEKTTLQEIHNSLQEDIIEITAQIEVYGKIFNNIKLLKDHIEAKKPNEAYLDTLWIYPVIGYQLKPNTSAFDALESRGVEIISNQSVRNKITKHYKVKQQTVINNFTLRRELQIHFIKYYFDFIYPRVDEEYIKTYDYSKEVQLPHDYEEILANPQIIMKFNQRLNENLSSIHEMKELIKIKESLSEVIQTELMQI